MLRAGALFALVLVSFTSGGGAAAASRPPVYYVNGSTVWCSDSTRSASRARPFCTIGAAAARAAGGATIKVASGTYRERVAVRVSGAEHRPILFTPMHGARVVITGATNGFAISGAAWIHINGFTITHTGEYGISVSSASHITLSNNRVRYSGAGGHPSYGIRLRNVAHSLVTRNTVDHNTNSGIALVDGSTFDVVTGNVTFANAKMVERAAAGIRLYSAPANIVTRNISHDNEDSGIELERSDDSVVSNNVSYDNGDHGVDVTAVSKNCRVLANSIYANVTAGINVEGGSTGATVANNISVQNGIDSPRTSSNIRVDAASVPGTSLNYDIVHVDGDQAVLLIWSSTSYRSLAALQASSGQELHGLDADPRWRNRGAGDFHLTSRSPAIDSATSRVPNQPIADINRTRRLDDPATPNTGSGFRLYDDRGAFEFRAARRQPQGPAAGA